MTATNGKNTQKPPLVITNHSEFPRHTLPKIEDNYASKLGCTNSR
jgi:hypothetical protein